MLLGAPRNDLTGPDFDKYPIWYCDLSTAQNDDFVFSPLLDTSEVTEQVCERGAPCIPLIVENTSLRCLGYFDRKKNTVFGIAIWMVDEWRGFNYVDAPRMPVILSAQVPILGAANRRFVLNNADDWFAKPLE